MSDIRPALDFTDDMFHLREGEKNFLGDDEDVRRATEYFKNLAGKEEWEKRRLATAKHFLNGLAGIATTGKGEYFQSNDIFAWYLFLAEAFNEHPWNYEYFSGARVIPIFASLGRNLDKLLHCDGFDARARELVSSAKAQPNGPIFEFLVAGAYLNDGAEVRFIPHTPAKKSFDLLVARDGKSWAVECKRMEVSDYGDSERMRMRELWQPISAAFASKGWSIYADVNFKCELTDISRDYLQSKVFAWVNSKQCSYLWDDESARGVIGELDMSPIQNLLRRDYVAYPSSRLIEVVTGTYRRNDNNLSLYKMKFGPNPKVIDEIDFAIVCRWQNLSDESISKKARDIKRKLAKANDQLPDDLPGVIHIGIEAVDGDEVERRRYEKIMETVKTFDPAQSNLEFVYCHYFAPEAPPNETWAFDETVAWYGIRPTKMPLGNSKLVMPDGVAMRDGVHWGNTPTNK